MRYIPHTEGDVAEMLRTVGVKSIEDLFAEVPESVRLQRPLDLPPAISETELVAELKTLASQNATVSTHNSFLGGGAYQHFLPAVVDHLISRSEFYTAYTPYQPEISQGTLQAIFEYQSLICMLTGMDVTNASMYDGASACAEAVLMAVRMSRRKKILLSRGVNTRYRQTVVSYCQYLGLDMEDVAIGSDGRTDMQDLLVKLDGSTAAFVAGYPNYFGVIEDLAELGATAHAKGVRMIVAVAEAVSLGLLKSPGELGADIVVGDGQSLGLPLSFGGPYVGFFAARQKDVRGMPGRLVGETTDLEGKRGYVLTLATREQHIRREKATSNICSNQALCALMTTVFMALLGKQGLRELAEQNLAKAAYAREQITTVPGLSLAFSGPVFNEFVIRSKYPVTEVLSRLESAGILGGIALEPSYPELSDCFLVCVTEQKRRSEIDDLINALKGGAV
ncbi:MAG: aminomethyl-transferring glycine dehydrogenase subunit GcvPA [Deltaproteobacteria bacterium]|jgi:glycine dehydrogenase subunit 1|nr:aminomethyl-transferring glycine dehydrogenase subunit GcvPA [Deltaproteobacteria bacterium]